MQSPKTLHKSRARLSTLRSLVIGAALVALAWPVAHNLRNWVGTTGDSVFKTDFALYVASSLQGLQYGWSHLWNMEDQRALFASISPHLWWFPNVYTPALSLAMVPFVHLPLQVGYFVWSAILLASLLVCWHQLAPGRWLDRALLLAMALAIYPVYLGLVMGQVLALQMAALALSYPCLKRGREALAGVLLVVIALKPQGMLLVPFALLVSGRSRAFAWWAGGMAAVGAICLSLVGISGAEDYLRRLSYAGSHPSEFWVGWSYTLARHFSSRLAAVSVELICAGTALAAAWRHREHPEVVVCAGLVGSLLASPFLHLNDLMLLFPAAWLLLRVANPTRAIPALLVCYGCLALCTDAGTHRWGRWVLLSEGLWLLALAAMPPRWFMRSSESTAFPAPGAETT